jgi:hypothetical protein
VQSRTIYMPLLNEGTDVWRPIQAEDLGDGDYPVFGPVPECGEWEFSPGSIVRVEMKRLSEGDAFVAVAHATN